MGVIVRQLERKDYPVLVSLFADLGYPSSLEEIRSRFEQLADQKAYHSLVAVLDDKVVGFSGLCKMYFFEKNGTYTRMLAFVVSGEVRQQGVGTILLGASEEWARKQGSTAVVLNSGNREERQPAHSFYTANGYVARSTGFSKGI